MKKYGIELPDVMLEQTERVIDGLLERMDAEGLLNPLDSVSWILLAGNLDKYFSTEERMMTSGGMVTKTSQKDESISAWFHINAKVQSLIQTALKDLGLTPMARSKMKKNEGSEEDTLLESLWKRRKN